MKSGIPQCATREIGKSQGYLGLTLSDRILPDGTPIMVTVWEPTPDEIAAINAGAMINLTVLGTAHPPVMLTVGKPPE